MKAIKQSKTREILDAYNSEEISYSRMNELFNEQADNWAIKFVRWCDENGFDGQSYKQALQKFKEEKGL